MSLFRPEVAQARNAQWLGVVRLGQRLSFTVVSVVAIGLVGLLVSFATWGDIHRKARLSGLLVPMAGALSITAPQSGVLREQRLQDGQLVQAGDVLAVIELQRDSLVDGSASNAAVQIALQIGMRRASLQSERQLRELQMRQRAQVLADRTTTLQAELRQLEQERTLQQSRLQLAEKGVQRQQQLADAGFVAEAQLHTRQEELIELRTRVQGIERTRLGLERDLATAQGERESLQTQLQTDLAQLDRSLASLGQEAVENSARKTVAITAPQAGVLSTLNLPMGQAVQAGQTLATLVPTVAMTAPAKPGAQALPNTLEAHLYAPSRQAGFVKPGQAVFVRYDAYPYQKFGLYPGQVQAVSATPFAANELPGNLSQQLMSQTGGVEALFRVTVAVDKQAVVATGEALPLKPGMTLQADVLLERRKVWEWVLEPLLAARANWKILSSGATSASPGG